MLLVFLLGRLAEHSKAVLASALAKKCQPDRLSCYWGGLNARSKGSLGSAGMRLQAVVLTGQIGLVVFSKKEKKKK